MGFQLCVIARRAVSLRAHARARSCSCVPSPLYPLVHSFGFELLLCVKSYFNFTYVNFGRCHAAKIPCAMKFVLTSLVSVEEEGGFSPKGSTGAETKRASFYSSVPGNSTFLQQLPAMHAVQFLALGVFVCVALFYCQCSCPDEWCATRPRQVSARDEKSLTRRPIYMSKENYLHGKTDFEVGQYQDIMAKLACSRR